MSSFVINYGAYYTRIKLFKFRSKYEDIIWIAKNFEMRKKGMQKNLFYDWYLGDNNLFMYRFAIFELINI